jgi:hypothetical protein
VLIILNALSFLGCAYKTESFASFNEWIAMKKGISLAWVSLMTWAESPCMLGIVAPLFSRLLSAGYTVSVLGDWIYVLCCLNLFLLLSSNLLIHKFFLVNIPSQRLPWSQSSSHFATLKPLVSLAAVVTQLYVTVAKIPPVFEISYYLIMPCMILSTA